MYLLCFSPPSPDPQTFCVKTKYFSDLGERGRKVQWQKMLNSIFVNDRPISGKYKLFWCLSGEPVELIDLFHLHLLLRHSLPQGRLKDKFLQSLIISLQSWIIYIVFSPCFFPQGWRAIRCGIYLPKLTCFVSISIQIYLRRKYSSISTFWFVPTQLIIGLKGQNEMQKLAFSH